MTDLIIYNSRIRTMDAADSNQISEATAVAVTDGAITALGSDEQLLESADANTELINAAGATLTPGLIDSHMHPVWGAELTEGIDFGGASSIDQIRQLITEAARQLPDGAWVRGWNLDYKAFPQGISGEDFDAAAEGHPFFGIFFDLHTGVANTAAMRAAEISGTEVFDDASEIVTDEHGNPTGELREIPAYMTVMDAAPAADVTTLLNRVREILQESASAGITSAAVMDGRNRTLELLDELEQRDGELPAKLHVALWHQPGDSDDLVHQRIELLGRQGHHYRVSMIKMFIDGVIDSGTAWLHSPDTEGDGTRSFWNSVDRYAEVAEKYHRAGFQLATHSCGDAGAATAMNVYESLGTPDTHHRIEHLETLTDEDVARLRRTSTVASMQPLHMQWREPDHSDPWAARLGADRAAHAFRTRDVIDASALLCLGSDWPVAQQDPRTGMAWARLRRAPGNLQAPVFEADQRLTGEEALLGYTRWAADALGRADLGRITVGAQADLALWAEDPVSAEADHLPQLPVLLTIRDGAVTHRASNTALFTTDS